ncbi:DUF1850 domain-containing protein [Bacillus salitolerans]|uniref:DUF1850 domain-containing protein n=1 Tax=Bacillus salitolerans TaxID=1437434 RepID=A0ABW4LNH0_9BACI
MKKSYVYYFVVILFCVAILFIPYKNALVIERENSGAISAYFDLNHGDRFEIQYTHSIHLSDVREYYQITRQGQIMQTKLIYEDYAIGMPSDALTGETFHIENGKIVISNMKRNYPAIDLRTGQVVANHQIIVHDKITSFSDFIKPGSWVKIKFRKISVIEMVKGVNMSGK